MFSKFFVKRSSTFISKKKLSSLHSKKTKFAESFVFPQEKEGNIYKVNWSLTEDGVTPVGNAYRNARQSLITKRLGVKEDSKVLTLQSPQVSGTYTLLESGDSISHNDFKDFKDAQKSYLSSGIDLFVEDASLGAYYDIRVGVRIISDNPSLSLIFRNLLIPTPPVDVDHRARFNGWNLDERWKSEEVSWNNEKSLYNVEDIATKPKKGQRPIVAFVGHVGDLAAIQFVELNAKVVGANIVIGDKTPIRALIHAIGIAADTLINENDSEVGISIPSHTIIHNNKTYVVVGGDDDFLKSVASKNILYGAYNNYISIDGVSALWNGYISPSQNSSSSPVICIKNEYIVANPPDNLINPAAEIFFIDKKMPSKKNLSEADILNRLSAFTGSSKNEVIKSLVKEGLKGTIFNSNNEALSIFS